MNVYIILCLFINFIFIFSEISACVRQVTAPHDNCPDSNKMNSICKFVHSRVCKKLLYRIPLKNSLSVDSNCV